MMIQGSIKSKAEKRSKKVEKLRNFRDLSFKKIKSFKEVNSEIKSKMKMFENFRMFE